MSEKTYTIRYQLEGVDKTRRSTKSIVYLLNAARLSVKDLKLVLDPQTRTVENMFWTAIQLTRTWTHFYRLVKMVSKEQDIVLAKSLAIRAATTGTIFQTRLGVGGRMIPSPGVWGTLAGLAAAHPVGTIVVGGIVIGGAMYAGYYWQQEQAKKAYFERMREIARTQGRES